MGLKEQIEKEEAELKKLGNAGENDDDSGDDEDLDDDTDGQDDDTDEDDAADDKANDKKAKEPPKKGADDKKGAKKADDEDDSDEDDDADPKNKNDAAAKLRLERKKRMKIEEELAALKKQPPVQPPVQQKPPVDASGKPKVETTEEKVARLEADDTARREVEARQVLHNQAVEEFNDIEAEFSKETPDYEDASAHMIKGMYAGVKAAYPDITDKQALQFVQNRVLQIASNAAKRGLNPAEVLYQMSFDNYGFQPGQKKPGENKNTKADNLKNIAKNKKRSANAFQGGGQNAGARATIEEANKMDLATFGNMSEAEIDELIAQAGSN